MPFSPDLAPLRPVPSAPAAPPLSGQAARFLLIGGVATVVDVGLFNVLHFGVGVGPLGAKVLSTVVAGIVAFAGNREFSFGHQKDRAMSRQLMAFTAVSAVALLLNLLVIAVARYGLDLSSALALNVAANGIGLVLATGFRFYGCRRWVFPPADRAPTHEPARAELERVAA